MSMFPRCDDRLEDAPSLEGGIAVNRRCDGTLVPIKVYQQLGTWLIDWRCTKCGRTM